MRLALAAIASALFALIGALPAAATPSSPITFDTVRERGFPGTWTASGAFSDAGTFTTLGVHISASHAPEFLIVHATFRFLGEDGEFTVRVDIKETVTEDPNVFEGDGNWDILDGTGAYARLHAEGTVHSLVDENADPDLFLRTFTGKAHFD